jgi:hypothetical protein
MRFTQPLTEISTRNIKIFLANGARPARKADNLTTICEPIYVSSFLTFARNDCHLYAVHLVCVRVFWSRIHVNVTVAVRNANTELHVRVHMFAVLEHFFSCDIPFCHVKKSEAKLSP